MVIQKKKIFFFSQLDNISKYKNFFEWGTQKEIIQYLFIYDKLNHITIRKIKIIKNLFIYNFKNVSFN